MPYLILTINILWALSITILHFNKNLWRQWENVTTKKPTTHYLIGGFNFFIITINVLLWYLIANN